MRKVGAVFTCFNVMHKGPGDGDVTRMSLINSSVQWAVDTHSRLTGNEETSPVSL